MQRTLERLEAAVTEVERLDEGLGTRLAGRISDLSDPIRDGLRGGGAPDGDDGFLAEGQTLVAETLEFLAAASARRLGLDDGLTALAQRWLDRLSATAQIAPVAVVIPAPTEFTGMLTQVVRLKLPSDGVWALPVAVHEFGHFVATQLVRRGDDGGVPDHALPVERLLHREGAGDGDRDGIPARYFHGHELFADAVAATVAGPAYLRYCLRYRFEPGVKEESTHPAPDVRVRMQLDALRALAGDDASSYMAAEVDALEEAWTAAGGTTDAPADLVALAAELLELVRSRPEIRRIHYHDHQKAQAMAETPRFVAPPSATVSHVLNAAWVRREQGERESDDASQRESAVAALAATARTLVEEVLDRDG